MLACSIMNWQFERRTYEHPVYLSRVTFAIYGYHFRKITENICWVGMFSDTSCLEQK